MNARPAIGLNGDGKELLILHLLGRRGSLVTLLAKLQDVQEVVGEVTRHRHSDLTEHQAIEDLFTLLGRQGKYLNFTQ